MVLKGVSESFKSRADSAAFWEAWVGAVLSRAGLYTLHHPFQIDGKDHGLTFDLNVYVDPLRTREIEVKSLSLTFNCPETYPFERVLVCSQSSWNRKWGHRDYTCRDFLFVSTTTGSIVWLPTMSQVQLGFEVTDKSRSETYKTVTCQRSALRGLDDFVQEVTGDQ